MPIGRISLCLILVYSFPFAYGANTTSNSSANSNGGSIAWTLVPILVSAAAVTVATFSVYYQRKQQRLSAILEAFRILNNPEHRTARENVYSAFKQYEHGQNKIFKNDLYHKSAAMVRADLDQIGMLVDRGLISKDMFLKIYWHTVLACWKALREDVKEHRSKRGYPSYMSYFEQLNNDAEIYRKEHHTEVTEIKVYSDDENDRSRGSG